MTLIRLWPYLAILLLGVLAYGFWQKSRASAIELEAVQAQLEQQARLVKDANKAIQERGLALAMREVEVGALRAQTGTFRSQIAALRRSGASPSTGVLHGGAEDPCINRTVPADLQRLLTEAFPGSS